MKANSIIATLFFFCFVTTALAGGHHHISEGRANTVLGIATVLGTVSLINQIVNPAPVVVYNEPAVVYTAPPTEVYVDNGIEHSTTYVVPSSQINWGIYSGIPQC